MTYGPADVLLSATPTLGYETVDAFCSWRSPLLVVHRERLKQDSWCKLWFCLFGRIFWLEGHRGSLLLG
jgi:hypothetical protein